MSDQFSDAIRSLTDEPMPPQVPTRPWLRRLIVTPEQWEAGFLRTWGGTLDEMPAIPPRQPFEDSIRLPDGNYSVQDPDQSGNPLMFR